MFPAYCFRETFSDLLFCCLDMTQDYMNGAPNEIRTHSCKFVSRIFFFFFFCFFRFCNGLYKGHCFVLDFSSSSFLSLSQSVSLRLSCEYISPINL